MIIVVGVTCVLREEGFDGNIDEVGMHFPPDYVVCRDPSGEYLRPCDFYICKTKIATIPDDRVNKDDETLAQRFYGNATKLFDQEVDIPSGDWQRMCLVDQIGYRRRGDRKGLFRHQYKDDDGNPIGVPLYECKGESRAWRLRLPIDCVHDERGFVKP